MSLNRWRRSLFKKQQEKAKPSDFVAKQEEDQTKQEEPKE